MFSWFRALPQIFPDDKKKVQETFAGLSTRTSSAINFNISGPSGIPRKATHSNIFFAWLQRVSIRMEL